MGNDDDTYVPAPSYRYRHRLYRKAVRGLALSPFLDIGAGRGDFSLWLAGRGAVGVVLDSSPRAAALLTTKLAAFPQVEIVARSWEDYLPPGLFSLVVLNEVLEHVADDARSLARAASWLRPDGHLLLSVPAHRRQWGWRDDVKGHLRRYERGELVSLLRGAGLAPVSFWSWGWPTINFLRWWDRKKEPAPAATREEATAASALTIDTQGVPRLLSREWVWEVPFAVMDLFLHTDWGVGYVVVARRVNKG